MIRVRPSDERGRGRYGWLDTRYSFSFAQYWDPNQMGFRSLRVINEDRIAAGAGFPEHGHEDMEIVTYVVEGSLAHRDSTGGVVTIGRGGVQVMSAGSGIRHSEFNASRDDELYLLQIWIQPAEPGGEPRHDEGHFPPDERRGRLQPIASGDGRAGSLRIGQDATVSAGLLEAGQSVEETLGDGRGAWLQLVRGRLELNGVELGAGDGAAIEGEEAVSMRALDEAEFLYFDLP